MARVPSRGSDQFVVRFPEGLRERIKVTAEENGRSMNAEIIATLEEKYPAPVSTERLEDVLKFWAPRILSEQDAAERARLIRGVNSVLEKIAPQAQIGFFPSDQGTRLGLIWQTSLFDKGSEIETLERSFPTKTSKP